MENIRPLVIEADYDWALAEVDAYFTDEPEPGTPEGDRFTVLLALIAAYEHKAWPIEAPDPVETIRSYMQTFDKKQSELADLIGSKSRASEVLNKHRSLTVDMIYRISSKWHIPADLMVRPYHLSSGTKAIPPEGTEKPKRSLPAAKAGAPGKTKTARVASLARKAKKALAKRHA